MFRTTVVVLGVLLVCVEGQSQQCLSRDSEPYLTHNNCTDPSFAFPYHVLYVDVAVETPRRFHLSFLSPADTLVSVGQARPRTTDSQRYDVYVGKNCVPLRDAWNVAAAESDSFGKNLSTVVGTGRYFITLFDRTAAGISSDKDSRCSFKFTWGQFTSSSSATSDTCGPLTMSSFDALPGLVDGSTVWCDPVHPPEPPMPARLIAAIVVPPILLVLFIVLVVVYVKRWRPALKAKKISQLAAKSRLQYQLEIGGIVDDTPVAGDAVSVGPSLK